MGQSDGYGYNISGLGIALQTLTPSQKQSMTLG